MANLVYLAGPITGLSYAHATSWRKQIVNKTPASLDIAYLSPMRAKEHLIYEQNLKDAYNHVLSTDKGITARDKWDVSRCSVMVANFLGAEKPSVGTCIEYGWASAYNKPIITIMESEDALESANLSTHVPTKNPHNHAMIRELSSYIVGSVDETVNLLVAMFTVETPIDWSKVTYITESTSYWPTPYPNPINPNAYPCTPTYSNYGESSNRD